MDSKNGYWQRQFYFLSSLGLFYVILIALFAIPLIGAFVVILIKGAMDLRYVIIAGGCVGLLALGFIVFRILRRLFRRLGRDGLAATEEVRRNLLLGQPVEVSILNGMLKLSCGQGQTDPRSSLAQGNRPLLPQPGGQDTVGGILDQLQQLSELKRTGAIDDDEFNLLKTMLMESSAPAKQENDRS